MNGIFQKALPYDVSGARALPGIQPLEMRDWLIRDEAFGAQMALCDHLLRTARADVLAMDESARAAARELLEMVLGLAYRAGASEVRRADGVRVVIDRDDPLGTLGRLVQEDLCILQKSAAQHVLSGAVVCFPASWLLSQKFNTPLTAIHAPVAGYDPDIAARVQRLFDGVQPGRPLWRFNALWYDDPHLHQPRGAHPTREAAHAASFLRSERQCILRLPETGAVIFSIHTYVLRRADLPGTDR